jgi:hypothetical protein
VSLDQMWRAYFAVGGKADHLFSTRVPKQNRKPILKLMIDPGAAFSTLANIQCHE